MDAARTDAPLPLRRALRDLAVAALAASGWLGAERAPAALQVGLAVATVGVAFLLHEWGHWLGGRLAGARLHPSRSWRSLFLFRFDTRNTTAQFVAMSLGGFLASALAVAVLLVALPSGHLASHVALALVALGVIATLVLEVPELLRVVASGRFPDGFAYVDGGAGEGGPET